MKAHKYTNAIAALLAAVMLSACGGGDDSEAASAFDRHSVSPQGVITAKAGEYVHIAVESQVFGEGATIASQTWSYTMQGKASGTLELADPDCANARKVSRAAANGTVVNWQCNTSVVAAAGSKGDFVLTAVVTDGAGNTELDSLTLHIVP